MDRRGVRSLYFPLEEDAPGPTLTSPNCPDQELCAPQRAAFDDTLQTVRRPIRGGSARVRRRRKRSSDSRSQGDEVKSRRFLNDVAGSPQGAAIQANAPIN